MGVTLHSLDKKLAVLQKETDLKFIFQEKALLLEKTEIARRLEILNGESGRLKDMQANYLPREVWDNAYKDISDKIDSLNTSRNTSAGRQSVITVVISVMVSGVFLLTSLYLK